MNHKCLNSLIRHGFSTSTSSTPSILKKKWNSVVGLEIHAQIASNSKLFSGSYAGFGQSPNTCASFFDCAIPGTLPVLNAKCVEAGVLTSLALSCKINEISYFDRKHYFYADLPSGYQITQQRRPIAIDGKCEFYIFNPSVHKKPYMKCSKIKQIQLEQDSGKSIYDENLNKTLIDLNRAGIPLMELIFEPDLSDGEEAAALVKELACILKELGTCSCKMEEGALRVDANISVHKSGEPLGIRTEVKNISSFRYIAKAIDFEINRQIQILENNGKIINETRSWNAETSKTISLRDKEEKRDYRFIPEPNLLPLHIHVDNDTNNENNLISAVSLKNQIPQLPSERRRIMVETFQIPLITVLQIMNVPELLQYFDNVIQLDIKSTPKQVANFFIINLIEVLYKNKINVEEIPVKESQLAELIDLVTLQEINVHVAKNVLSILLSNPHKRPREVVEENDWYQIKNEEELKKICQNVLENNPKLVSAHKKGKKVLQKLLTIVAKQTNDRAHMAKASQILKEMLQSF